MPRSLWIPALLALAVFDAWCFWVHWSAVAGNVAASVIWATPALAVHHLAVRRRQDRRHAEQTGRQVAQAEQLAVVAVKVGELHDLSIEGHLPARILRP